jgi:hypothetical protein
MDLAGTGQNTRHARETDTVKWIFSSAVSLSSYSHRTLLTEVHFILVRTYMELETIIFQRLLVLSPLVLKSFTYKLLSNVDFVFQNKDAVQKYNHFFPRTAPKERGLENNVKQ